MSRGARSHVGFLAHFIEPEDLLHFEPGLRELPAASFSGFLDRIYGVLAPFVVTEATIRSPAGGVTDVSIIAVPFTTEQALSSRRAGDGVAVGLVRKAVALAALQGCRTVGLGAYTSIVSDNGRLVDDLGVAVTTGNSLAVVAGVEGLVATARRLGIAGRKVGVTGAAGNIGAMAARLLASHAEQLILCGGPRALPRLSRLAQTLPPGTLAFGDLAALRTCDWILCCSSAREPILRPEHVGPQPVVICDLAVPADVDPTVRRSRPRATVIVGGAVRLPLGQSVGVRGVEIEPGLIPGCLAETLVLGLAGVRGHFSCGPLQLARIKKIQALAARHGLLFEEPPWLPRTLAGKDSAPDAVRTLDHGGVGE